MNFGKPLVCDGPPDEFEESETDPVTRGNTFQTTFSYDVRPGIGTLRGAVANGTGSKAFVLLVRFYDERDNLIPGPYLRFSHSRLGAYRYIAGGSSKAPKEFDVPFFMPEGACRLDAIFCGWETEEPVQFGRPLQPGGQIRLRLPRPAISVQQPSAPSPLSAKQRSVQPGPILVCKGRFEAQRLYEIDIDIAAGQGDREKAHLLVVECEDDAGQAIETRLPGLSYSETAGNYIYVSFADEEETVHKTVKISPPEGAAGYRILLRRWYGKGSPRILALEQRTLLDHAAQVEVVTQQVEIATASIGSICKSLAVITATTRPLESANRLNRPQALAQEFAHQGFLVFYIYYRFVKTEPLPERNFEGILQIPNDIFQIVAPRIASLRSTGLRIALFSIPDDISVRQLGVFQWFRWRTIYEVRDDWEEFAAANVGKWYNSLWERFLASNCAQTICVSPALVAKMLMFGCSTERVSLSHNATTQRFIETAEPFRRRRVTTRSSNDQLVFGYFGHLTEAWFDWPLILQAALQRPEWNFEFIGFGAPDNLNTPSNVVIKDAVTQLELPALSQRWDVGMIPFRPSPLSRAVDPIKIYDYLALGLPTLSVQMSLIHQMDNVHIYEGLDDFLTKAEGLVARLREGPLDWPTPAWQHTWAARVRQIAEQATHSA